MMAGNVKGSCGSVCRPPPRPSLRQRTRWLPREDGIPLKCKTVCSTRLGATCCSPPNPVPEDHTSLGDDQAINQPDGSAPQQTCDDLRAALDHQRPHSSLAQASPSVLQAHAAASIRPAAQQHGARGPERVPPRRPRRVRALLDIKHQHWRPATSGPVRQEAARRRRVEPTVEHDRPGRGPGSRRSHVQLGVIRLHGAQTHKDRVHGAPQVVRQQCSRLATECHWIPLRASIVL
mmetsp:Transcript_139008/g.387715  ORF Transcript_139008/g.387715 Transcript_139008/m.387715 type:complete len:234 (+) Transcript_139008:109-810(+)